MFRHMLILDDDRDICAVIKSNLELNNYRVSTAHDTTEARRIMARDKIDLILLDWKLCTDGIQPHAEDGFEFLRALRRVGDSTAVIMVTTNVGYDESASVLEGGADDYVRKPFDHADLIARIKAVLRRTHKSVPGAIAFDGCVFNLATHRLFSQDGTEIRLRASESLLLSIFATRPHQILDRRTLAEFVFGTVAEYEKRSVDNLMVDLREKLPDSQVIKTVRGRGYMFAAHVNPHLPTSGSIDRT